MKSREDSPKAISAPAFNSISGVKFCPNWKNHLSELVLLLPLGYEETEIDVILGNEGIAIFRESGTGFATGRENCTHTSSVPLIAKVQIICAYSSNIQFHGVGLS